MRPVVGRWCLVGGCHCCVLVAQVLLFSLMGNINKFLWWVRGWTVCSSEGWKSPNSATGHTSPTFSSLFGLVCITSRLRLSNTSLEFSSAFVTGKAPRAPGPAAKTSTPGDKEGRWRLCSPADEDTASLIFQLERRCEALGPLQRQRNRIGQLRILNVSKEFH